MVERRSGDRPERRRGHPPVPDPMIVVSVRIPARVLTERYQEAVQRRMTLAELLRERLGVNI
jgi:hypothetical protein